MSYTVHSNLMKATISALVITALFAPATHAQELSLQDKIAKIEVLSAKRAISNGAQKNAVYEVNKDVSTLNDNELADSKHTARLASRYHYANSSAAQSYGPNQALPHARYLQELHEEMNKRLSVLCEGVDVGSLEKRAKSACILAQRSLESAALYQARSNPNTPYIVEDINILTLDQRWKKLEQSNEVALSFYQNSGNRDALEHISSPPELTPYVDRALAYNGCEILRSNYKIQSWFVPPSGNELKVNRIVQAKCEGFDVEATYGHEGLNQAGRARVLPSDLKEPDFRPGHLNVAYTATQKGLRQDTYFWVLDYEHVKLSVVYHEDDFSPKKSRLILDDIIKLYTDYKP